MIKNKPHHSYPLKLIQDWKLMQQMIFKKKKLMRRTTIGTKDRLLIPFWPRKLQILIEKLLKL